MRVRTLALPAVVGLLGLVLAACSSTAASPTPPPPPAATAAASSAPSGSSVAQGFELRRTPANLGCDAIGVEYTSFTFKIDPSAAEPVTATANTGTLLTTFWTNGFRAGGAGDALVYDPKGEIVARDGDSVTKGERLHGYFVCLAPDSIYVLEADPAT